ncbi:hypothetical protein QU487_07710 [Crenobacter sp. SG2305]|uniref:hypothetical protein n=1 Tax=Crenobacter oryzisoli TaxID=3056844 RepID=UPI0025AA5417|nr:hypothetical protein [Crenobacter sp. SG2305]MDN0082634.1 hypothetical protein [Crenobacter sp. SG2305]
MKRLIPLVVVLALAGCANFKMPSYHPPTRPAPVEHPPSSSDLMLHEANRIAERVKAGELNRVQAADQLNAYRLRTVGHNAVDDDVFATYRQIAVQRDANQISQEEAQARMDAKLRETLRRWPKLKPKPANPAFTNFLLKVYGLPPLGY